MSFVVSRSLRKRLQSAWVGLNIVIVESGREGPGRDSGGAQAVRSISRIFQNVYVDLRFSLTRFSLWLFVNGRFDVWSIRIDKVMRLKALRSAFSALPAGIFTGLSIRTLAKELIELSQISISSSSTTIHVSGLFPPDN